jgi:hypothetical protein
MWRQIKHCKRYRVTTRKRCSSQQSRSVSWDTEQSSRRKHTWKGWASCPWTGKALRELGSLRGEVCLVCSDSTDNMHLAPGWEVGGSGPLGSGKAPTTDPPAMALQGTQDYLLLWCGNRLPKKQGKCWFTSQEDQAQVNTGIKNWVKLKPTWFAAWWESGVTWKT